MSLAEMLYEQPIMGWDFLWLKENGLSLNQTIILLKEE